MIGEKLIHHTGEGVIKVLTEPFLDSFEDKGGSQIPVVLVEYLSGQSAEYLGVISINDLVSFWKKTSKKVSVGSPNLHG